MYVRPTAPLSIGGVLDDSIRVYRASFSKCWVPSLLVAAVGGVFGIWMSYTLGVNPVGAGRAKALAALSLYRQPTVMGIYLLQWLLTTALYGALFVAQDGATGGKVQGLGEAFGIGFARLGRSLLATVLFTVFLIVGFLLLLIPGFYVLGAFCLWPVALYVDDAGGTSSLGASYELTKGNWWRTSIILTVAVIIILVFTMLVGLVIGIAVTGFRHDLAIATLIIQLIAIVANVFYLPMYTAVLISIYRDLKLRREGGDLAAKLGALPAN